MSEPKSRAERLECIAVNLFDLAFATYDQGFRKEEYKRLTAELRALAAEVERLEDVLRKMLDQWTEFATCYDNKYWGNNADAYNLLAKALQNEWDEAKRILEPEASDE